MSMWMGWVNVILRSMRERTLFPPTLFFALLFSSLLCPKGGWICGSATHINCKKFRHRSDNPVDPTSLSSLRGLDTREEVYECVSTGTSGLHSLKDRSIERQAESYAIIATRSVMASWPYQSNSQGQTRHSSPCSQKGDGHWHLPLSSFFLSFQI